MSVVKDKRIILGICGGIAAYKSAELVRLLVKQGAQVQVVMTRSAQEFVTPMTFQALSGREVRTALFDPDVEAGMGHIELARWADVIIIAPATANTIAKIAHGIADDLLTTLCLATQAILLIAPAMNQKMWLNEATQENIERLSRRQAISFCGPAEGEQACGDMGPGRMAEPDSIFNSCAYILGSEVTRKNLSLKGKCVLVTAGPTIEDIDPVRYISNRSSGKMGYAIAQAALDEGADVLLISGPTALEAPENSQFFGVRSALQMHEKVLQMIDSVDIFIATAAVADYRPVEKVDKKIKKDAAILTIELLKNPDILAAVAALPNRPVSIGFAAETNELETNALDKLKRKKLDLIAANKVSETQGFDADNNELHLFWGKGKDRTGKKRGAGSKKLAFASKKQLAKQLINEIVLLFVK